MKFSFAYQLTMSQSIKNVLVKSTQTEDAKPNFVLVVKVCGKIPRFIDCMFCSYTNIACRF